MLHDAGRWRQDRGILTPMRRLAFVLAAVAFVVLAACRPSSATDAEAKGDVGYLSEHDSPDAIAALGRLADKDPKAEAALASKPTLDTYIAAWAAVQRGAPWGTKRLTLALGEPEHAENAAKAMGRGDARLSGLVDALEGAVKAGCIAPCASVLASAGASGAPAVTHLLENAKTRESMCNGLASVDATKETRAAFFHVNEAARDAPACLRAASAMAAVDDDALEWLAKSAESGLVGGASKSDVLPCAKLETVWDHAIKERPAASFSALTIPLAAAIKRCPAELDVIVADALTGAEAAQILVVQAIDPLDASVHQLRATCDVLVGAVRGRLPMRVRDRASDTLAKCDRK